MVWLLDNLYPFWVIVKNSFLAIGIVCESLWILFFIIQMQTFIADWLSVCLILCPSVRKPACKNVWLGYIPSVIKRQHQKSTLISIGIGLWWYPWPPIFDLRYQPYNELTTMEIPVKYLLLPIYYNLCVLWFRLRMMTLTGRSGVGQWWYWRLLWP